MKAITYEDYGTTDVLDVRDVDKPEIRADEVLIRVHGAGVDRGEDLVPVELGVGTRMHPRYRCPSRHD